MIRPEQYQTYSEIIRSGQIPDHAVPKLLADNPDFAAWYSPGRRLVEIMVETNRRAYVRERDLPKLIAFLPSELSSLKNYSIAGTQAIIDRIRKPLRAHYALALSDHWSYSAARHVALLGAFRAERDRLETLLEAAA